MKYQGGKHRTGKVIVDTILNNVSDTSGVFYDLFCGSCAVIKHVPDSFVKIANDIDGDLIQLLQRVQLGLIPKYTNKEITKEVYYQIKEYKSPHYMKAFAGIFGSYAGKKWGGYARGENRDYFQEAYKGLTDLYPEIQNVLFFNKVFNHVPIVPNSIIYCDPPYQGTTGYKNGIDYDMFYDYLRMLKNEKQCHIFVSEYNMPDDFISIWQKEQKTTLAINTDDTHKRIDKLWMLA